MTRVSDGKEIPDGQPLRIESMTAYIAFDEEDQIEGIVAFFNNGTWMPMVAADAEMIASLRAMAELTAVSSGKKVSLVKFSNREVLIEDILAEGESDDALHG